MTEPDAKPVTDALTSEGSTWRNEFAPRVAFHMPRYKRGNAHVLRIPILFCIADNDVQASPEFAMQVAAEAPSSEVRRYPVGHFGLYVGDARERVTADQVAFLARHLVQ